MKIIYNKYFPLKPFYATNICGIIFCRSDKPMPRVTQNHEYIHTLQQREMLYLGFTLWYTIEWIYRYIKCGNFMQAYHDTYFEREAYGNQHDLDYAAHRKPFAWWHQFVKKGTFLHEFGQFIGDIAEFVRDDFKWAKYLYFITLAVTIAVLQIHFHVYDWAIAPSYDNGTSMLCLPALFIFAYFLMLIPSLFIHGETWRLKQWQVWVLPMILLTIDGMGQGFHVFRDWIAGSSVNFNEKNFLNSVGSFLFRSVFIVSSLIVFKKCLDGKFGLLGVTRSSKYLRIYGTVFCILVPIFVVVSMTPQFLSYYPKAHYHLWTGSFGLPSWAQVSLFEVCYANDFLGVESMFRGALVIGMSRWLGPRAVLPMAISYMCIHLGKPDMELCSSVVGGYLLGTLAYKTKHLWGGIIVHLCIAMLFEALGIMHGM